MSNMLPLTFSHPKNGLAGMNAQKLDMAESDRADRLQKASL